MRDADAGARAPCAVIHLDLEAVAAPLAAPPGRSAVLAVFWLDGRPRGERLFLAAELPVPAAALRTLGAAAAAAAREADELAPVPPARDGSGLAVVVCTRDRPDDLDRCLGALGRCDPAPAEIVVVDNAPGSGVAAAVVARHPGTRLVAEPRPGLSHARNRGIAETEAPVVAFTDDDVEVAPDWVGRLAARFADEDTASVTGAVLPSDLASAAACRFEFEVGGLNNGYATRRFDRGFLRRAWYKSAPVWRIGAGANMALRRTALAAVGGFDPRLGAGAAGCSEDSELWFRLLRAGRACIYDPAAVVHHRHRGDAAALDRQLRAYMRGHVVGLLVQFGQDRSWSHLMRIGLFLPRHYLKLWTAALWHGDRNGRAVIGPQVRGWAEGALAGPGWLRREGPPRIGDAPPDRRDGEQD